MLQNCEYRCVNGSSGVGCSLSQTRPPNRVASRSQSARSQTSSSCAMMGLPVMFVVNVARPAFD